MKLMFYLVVLSAIVALMSCSQGNKNEVKSLSKKEIEQGWELLY